MRSHLSILDLTAQAIAVLFRNFSPVSHIFEAFLFPISLPISFSVSGFMWSSLIHLDLTLVQGDRMDQFAFFYMITPVVPAPFVENAVFFPLDGFSSLVKDQVTIGVWVHFWVFNSIPLVYLSVTIPVPCSFYHNCSVVSFRSGMVIPPEVLLSLRRVFAILGFCYSR